MEIVIVILDPALRERYFRQLKRLTDMRSSLSVDTVANPMMFVEVTKLFTRLSRINASTNIWHVRRIVCECERFKGSRELLMNRSLDLGVAENNQSSL